MSGHSKWATIHRQKESKDAKRGLIFTKLGRAITIAARSGPDPDANFKLRLAIDKARVANMPKENIERAISRSQSGIAVEETTYEGFGPQGVAVIVQAVTDNKNRTSQEIKNLFERNGGRMAGPGSVSYQFEQVGQLIVKKNDNAEEQMLSLIDARVEDMEESADGIEIYTKPAELNNTREKIAGLGFGVVSAELTMKPLNLVSLGSDEAQKVVSFLETLQNHDDVQAVYANLDIHE
ncbi:YebC/PmpR family DNA-binding transcriptional regulator [Candidatus Microgenomates bacterium]|nr:YebC/PmpR family DNA-binding transcriptional regulator [Candidatus Microgenomates bacterium]